MYKTTMKLLLLSSMFSIILPISTVSAGLYDDDELDFGYKLGVSVHCPVSGCKFSSELNGYVDHHLEAKHPTRYQDMQTEFAKGYMNTGKSIYNQIKLFFNTSSSKDLLSNTTGMYEGMKKACKNGDNIIAICKKPYNDEN